VSTNAERFPWHPGDLVLERPEYPGPMVIEAKAYIARSTIIYAKTMPKTPHWYLVRGRPRNDPGHEVLFELMRDHYWSRWWGGKWWRSIDLDGWSWWLIEDGTVINTKPRVRAGWGGDPKPPKGWLPDEFRRNLNASDRAAFLAVLNEPEGRLFEPGAT
jgi:hypothetical protein